MLPDDLALVIQPAAFHRWHCRRTAIDIGQEAKGFQDPLALITDLLSLTILVGKATSNRSPTIPAAPFAISSPVPMTARNSRTLGGSSVSLCFINDRDFFFTIPTR